MSIVSKPGTAIVQASVEGIVIGEKLIRDGRVAVLYSPGYGAGWSTWNDNDPAMVFDANLAEAVLSEDLYTIEQVAASLFPDAYNGGVYQLQVQWVEQGSRFEINDYDGSESVRLFGPDRGHLA